MATTVKTIVRVEVPGVGTVSDTHAVEQVEAIDKIEVQVPEGGSAAVEVQPGGAGQVKLLLLTTDAYGQQLSYTVDGGVADVALDAPVLVVGAAVGLLGAAPQKITFSNAAAAAATVRILVGRDATPPPEEE